MNVNKYERDYSRSFWVRKIVHPLSIVGVGHDTKRNHRGLSQNERINSDYVSTLAKSDELT